MPDPERATLRERSFRRRPSIVDRTILDERLLVPVRGRLAQLRRIYALNAVAGFVWDQLEEWIAFAEIHRRLIARYDVADEVAAGDLEALLGEMTAAEIVDQQAPDGRGAPVMGMGPR